MRRRRSAYLASGPFLSGSFPVLAISARNCDVHATIA
jgi:hypothetical protein